MIVLLFILCLAIDKTISTIAIPNVKPSDCSNLEYFQFSSIQCLKCGENQEKSQDMLSCQCVAGSKLNSDFGGPSKTCVKCEPPLVSIIVKIFNLDF